MNSSCQTSQNFPFAFLLHCETYVILFLVPTLRNSFWLVTLCSTLILSLHGTVHIACYCTWPTTCFNFAGKQPGKTRIPVTCSQPKRGWLRTLLITAKNCYACANCIGRLYGHLQVQLLGLQVRSIASQRASVFWTGNCGQFLSTYFSIWNFAFFCFYLNKFSFLPLRE